MRATSNTTAALLLLLATGCRTRATEVINAYGTVAEGFVADRTGRPLDQLADAGTLLHRRILGSLTPLTTPQGQQVTWGAYAAATGSVQVHCNGADTTVTVNADRLLGGATYFPVLMLGVPPGLREGGGKAVAGFVPLDTGAGSLSSPEGQLTATATVSPMRLDNPDNERTASLPPCLVDAYEFTVFLLYQPPPVPEFSENPSLVHIAWFFVQGEASRP